MKILVLEDNPIRCDWFRYYLLGEDVDFVDNPDDAIKLLETNTYERIYLDHDLLPIHYGGDINCAETTGLKVAIWLGENREASRGAIITIHSRNEYGSERMRKALTEGYRHCYLNPFNKMSGISI